MIDINAVYEPKSYEDRIWSFWSEKGLFTSKPDAAKKPYTILMPPPNVTSQLHMGHGLGYSIQDLLIRWKRMCGFNAMWLPGTDHAGIATQMMVEKKLESEGKSRKELGRESFVGACQDWKDKYGNIILEQFAKMGFSCDWSRVSYTMDPDLSKAVRWVFVQLYNEGLIYRGERLVNWDPVLKTALSDDELENKEIPGHLWYFRYPVVGTNRFIPIATTRPETMLGDTAVAVNPEDPRYKDLIGKTVALPFTDRSIPIVADDYVKSEFGTGAVKITPAHDPNDFEIGKRHNLPMINIMNDDATLNGNVPEEFQGLDRFAARKKVLKGLKALDLFDKEESYKHSVPHSDRSKTIIEPKLSKQWYVRMRDLAAPAAAVAREDRLKFHPESWKKTYLYWLDNIQDWCISRQLWWGHRIPIWYCQSCQEATTGIDDPQSCAACGHNKLEQDEDVLDTWFSSWLWPLSPLGWPQEGKQDLDYYYPTSTLVTAPEIIFLWVARMVMVGLKFKGDVPFTDVYFNATVCDKKGRKFSKTLGNGIDPLEVIDTHGADAVRYTAISLAPLGGRVRMGKDDFDNGSRFINKLWNASRMIFQHLEPNQVLPSLKSLDLDKSEKWLIDRLHHTAAEININLSQYRVNDAVEKLYHFIWGSLCDWGLEAAKETLRPDAEPEDRLRCLSVLVYCLDGALRLAHPVIPFVTEELWQKLPKHPDWQQEEYLACASYPEAKSIMSFPEAATEWQDVQDLITCIRSVRTQAGIPPKEKLAATIKAQVSCHDNLQSSALFIKRLAKLASLQVSENPEKPSKTLTGVSRDFTVYLPVEGLLDLDAETKRLSAEAEKISKILKGIEAKLANESFLARAPAEVVAETKQKQQDLTNQLKEIQSNLASLS